MEIRDTKGIVQRRYVYDLQGNIIKSIDAIGYESGETEEDRIGTMYAYNALGWLLEERAPVRRKEDGEVEYRLVSYAYDLAGNCIEEKRYLEYQSERSARGKVHRIFYVYDKEDRLIKVRDSLGAEIEYRYNCENQRIYERKKIGEGNYQTSEYHYDEVGNIRKVSYSTDKKGSGKSFASIVYQYDKNGNITKIKLPYGAEIRREYDVLDRLTAEEHQEKESGIENRREFYYDKIGNLIKIRDGRGRETRYQYDLLNQETHRIETDGSVERKWYNKNGLLEKVISPKEYEEKGEEGVGTQYAYDRENRLIEVRGADGKRKEAKGYDKAGRLEWEEDGTGSGIRYRYDIGSRRIEAETKGKRKQEYAYDARNRLRAIESGGKRKEYEYDEAGNLRRDEKGKYEYDVFHRMTKAELFTGEVQVNRYDAEGLRYEVEENGRLVEYLYRGEEVVAERNEKEEKRYIRGIELLASDAKEASTYYHYSSDELGSIRYISKGEEIANAYSYDAWGNLEKAEERVENRFYYAGEQRDPLTEQYYLRARYYNPVIGRFTQEDTYHGDGLNLYSYCRNNPIMYIDPNGNICEAAAERIRRKGDSATASEREALASYDRHRERLERQLNGVIMVTPEGEAWLPGRNTRNDDVIRLANSGVNNPEAHSVVNYAKLKEQYRVAELGNDIVNSLTTTGRLPSNYITKSQAKALGWTEGKALNNYAPGKALGGDIFANTTGVLPSSTGRVWYEADVGINYKMSRSNPKNPAYRILYSNDGLIYGTYDHYKTVFQIYP